MDFNSAFNRMMTTGEKIKHSSWEEQQARYDEIRKVIIVKGVGSISVGEFTARFNTQQYIHGWEVVTPRFDSFSKQPLPHLQNHHYDPDAPVPPHPRNVQLRIELDVSAQKIMQQLHLDNNLMEEQVHKGIKLAVEELTVDDGLVQMVKETALNELKTVIHKAVLSYELKNKISKSVEERLEDKFQKFADEFAEMITKDLKL
jgi:hypothetical protein